MLNGISEVISFSYPCGLFGIRFYSLTIIKREDGCCIISEKTERNLGRLCETRIEAIERLRQVEFSKQKKRLISKPRIYMTLV